MKNFLRTTVLLGISFVLGSSIALAQSSLDNPGPNSIESGIGVISGWHCTAREIRVEIDGVDQGLAGMGTSRFDTRSICGRSDTGFSLLVNYNVLSPGLHSIRVFADGALLTQRQFLSERSAGREFATGLSRSQLLSNFPDVGFNAMVSWSESKQGYVVKKLTRWGQERGRISDLYGDLSIEYMFRNEPAVYAAQVRFTAADRNAATSVIVETPQFLVTCLEANVIGLEFLCASLLETGEIEVFQFNVAADGSIAGDYIYCPDGFADEQACIDKAGESATDGTVTGIINRGSTLTFNQAQGETSSKQVARQENLGSTLAAKDDTDAELSQNEAPGSNSDAREVVGRALVGLRMNATLR